MGQHLTLSLLHLLEIRVAPLAPISSILARDKSLHPDFRSSVDHLGLLKGSHRSNSADDGILTLKGFQ